MRYDLTRLGAQEFEEMSQALAIAVLGGAVSVFGAGPDGGREATFEGLMRYPQPEPDTGPWNGYGVLQAKFRRTAAVTGPDTDWFLGEVRKELNSWINPRAARVKQGRVPQYLIFTTNVVLSPDPGRGGIDKVDQLINYYVTEKNLALRGWAVWHHDRICRLLDVHDGVRRTYAGFTLTGDVLAEAQRALASLTAEQIPSTDFPTLLTGQAAKELMNQQWVRLGQAGEPTNRKLQLSNVAIDLPAQLEPGPRDKGHPQALDGVVAYIVGQGDLIRRGQPASATLPHLTVVGGPGQGKTTLGQLLCQVYRVALLADRPTHTLGPDVPDLLERYQRHLRTLGIPIPRCRRWPVRVALSQFADVLAERRSTSLLDYISDQARRTGPINRLMTRAWLREWPWLVVLDGLDEVADPDNRDATLAAIRDFLVDAAQAEADLLVVATTRPQGYRGELSPAYYRQLTLQSMQADRSLDYAEHLAHLQYADDQEMRELLVRRLRTAAAESITARLMRTPLQVTIMSLLLERRARAPQDRYGLFEAYYTTLYDREISKDTPDSRLMDAQRRNIDRIHERVGLLLQIRAEHAGEAEAQLPEADLRRMIRDRLVEEGHRQDEAERLAGKLLALATDRLVLLVGLPKATIGFEVRSLQELMAARALFTSGEAELIPVLKHLAVSAHWRNTWLFAASKVFTDHETLRNDILLMLDELDTTDPFAAWLLPGATLAVDMLDEDIAAQQPRYTQLLLTRALRLLDTYPGDTVNRLMTVVHRITGHNPGLIHQVMTAINTRINSRGKAAVTALDALAAWAQRPGDASVSARNRFDRINNSTPLNLQDAVDQLRAHSRNAIWQRQGIERPDSELEPLHSVLARVTAEIDLPTDRRPQLEKATGLLSENGPRTANFHDQALQQSLVDIVDAFEPHLWPYASLIQQILQHRHARQTVDDTPIIGLTEPRNNSR
ncbi:NACHT domain-containing protein [Kibdelosporangium lantanae]|uniref:NACHT domain-containing protein n=1 Tax=Kibdelosporangium lantanae TaxID=1497396 RepID=A0ABW3M0P5_9PSEU